MNKSEHFIIKNGGLGTTAKLHSKQIPSIPCIQCIFIRAEIPSCCIHIKYEWHWVRRGVLENHLNYFSYTISWDVRETCTCTNKTHGHITCDCQRGLVAHSIIKAIMSFPHILSACYFSFAFCCCHFIRCTMHIVCLVAGYSLGKMVKVCAASGNDRGWINPIKCKFKKQTHAFVSMKNKKP